MSKADWMRSVLGDIDPAKHAGEGWFSTDEYPTARGIDSPYTRGEVGREGEYYPGPLFGSPRFTP